MEGIVNGEWDWMLGLESTDLDMEVRGVLFWGFELDCFKRKSQNR